MNNFFRTIIAGYGAKKLGGGCFSTILIFIVIYYLLGQCNKTPQSKNTFIEKEKSEHVWINNDAHHVACFRLAA